MRILFRSGAFPCSGLKRVNIITHRKRYKGGTQGPVRSATKELFMENSTRGGSIPVSKINPEHTGFHVFLSILQLKPVLQSTRCSTFTSPEACMIYVQVTTTCVFCVQEQPSPQRTIVPCKNGLGSYRWRVEL